MKDYEWILFDADDTLFHFDAFCGLKLMFSRFGVDFTQDNYQAYQAINKPLWIEYQNGAITAQQLQQQRFETWASKLETSPETLNSAFLCAMAEICTPLDGAESLLNTLKGKVKLGIITNGFTELQMARLERTGFKDYFELLVISEQVGVAKPAPGIFEQALSMMGNPDRKRVLMVGDNLNSDILGGLQVGLDTCWLNAHHAPTSVEIKPQYQVSSLKELEVLLGYKKEAPLSGAPASILWSPSLDPSVSSDDLTVLNSI